MNDLVFATHVVLTILIAYQIVTTDSKRISAYANEVTK